MVSTSKQICDKVCWLAGCKNGFRIRHLYESLLLAALQSDRLILRPRPYHGSRRWSSCRILCAILWSRACNCLREMASKAEKGSSINRIFGSPMIARTMPIRCCSPPDNSLGNAISIICSRKPHLVQEFFCFRSDLLLSSSPSSQE